MKKPSYIVSSSKIQVEKILHFTTKGTWALLIALFLFFGACIVVSLTMPSKYERHFISKVLLPQLESPSLEKIGKGPLSLVPLGEKSLLPDLSEEIVLLGKNIKPGRAKKKGDLLISLKSSKGEYKAKSGEIIFLSCDPVAGGGSPVYHFSEQKTPLWITPIVFDQNKVLIEACHFAPSKESELFQEEKVQFVAKEEGTFNEGSIKGAFIEELKKTKLWGLDVLLYHFGGSKYKSLKDKVKLEIPGRYKTVFCFVGQGDLLLWKEQGWHPVTKGDCLEEAPVAKVKEVSSKFIELEVWDPEGFSSSSFRIERQAVSKSGLKGENLPHSVRLRTSTQVSCAFGKKHCLMRQGDWILKTEMGFRNLKRTEDIENYLQHRLTGDLFIFDSLVEEQGKCVMKGFWIDKMRVQSQPFSVPVSGNTQNKISFKKEKKSPFMKKSNEESITYFPEVCMQEVKEIW